MTSYPYEGRTSEACRQATVAALRGFLADWWVAILGVALMLLWTGLYEVLSC